MMMQPYKRYFAGVATGKILVAYRRDLDLNIDAIEERAGYARAIALDLQRRADAFFLRIGEKTARAGVHRRDQHDGRGIIDRAEGAGRGSKFHTQPTLTCLLIQTLGKVRSLKFKRFYPARGLHFTRLGYSRLDPVIETAGGLCAWGMAILEAGMLLCSIGYPGFSLL
jgi:hypothetical protein